jgi:hypothetical protein
MAKYINPYTDFGFKKLFGEEANKDLLTYIEVKEVVKTAEMDGERKKALEIAKKLKEMGFPKNQIKEATGLLDEEIDEL